MNEEQKPDWVKEAETVKKPYTEAEMNAKVEAMRNDVTQKLNKWSNKIVFAVSSGAKPIIKREEGEIRRGQSKMVSSRHILN